MTIKLSKTARHQGITESSVRPSIEAKLHGIAVRGVTVVKRISTFGGRMAIQGHSAVRIRVQPVNGEWYYLSIA